MSYPCLRGKSHSSRLVSEGNIQAKAAGGGDFPLGSPVVGEGVQIVWHGAAYAQLVGLPDTHKACKPRTPWLMFPTHTSWERN